MVGLGVQKFVRNLQILVDLERFSQHVAKKTGHGLVWLQNTMEMN